MIKSSKIDELINSKVADILSKKLEAFDFKFFKSKKCFVRQNGIFKQTIYLSKASKELTYQEENEELSLNFTLYLYIEIPEFEKWYLEKMNETLHFRVKIGELNSSIKLKQNDISQDDTFIPSKSQEFKNYISYLIGGNTLPNFYDLEELLSDQFPYYINEFNNNSDILHIFKSGSIENWSFIALLFYGNYNEIGVNNVQSIYEKNLKEIEINKSETAVIELSALINWTRKIANIELENPYERTIKLNSRQNLNFKIAENLSFNEKLRIDISQYSYKSHDINKVGEILLFLDNKIIIKLDSKGEIIFQKQLEFNKVFKDFDWVVIHGLINNSNDFYVNNYIIKSDNNFIELKLNVDFKSKKRLSPNIADLTFSLGDNKYFILYSNKLLSYNQIGEFLDEIVISQGRPTKIIVEKKWIVSQINDKRCLIYDFSGNLLDTIEYGNGNNNIEFSPDYENLVCSFYTVKSQFYTFSEKKTKTIWAHPTFVKEYKELLYNDTYHNFGLNKVKFSPDNKYLVGAGDHGKYVAWTLPKLDRVELIPGKETIDILYKHNLNHYHLDTKIEVVKLDNQEFFRNRNNHVTNIFFLDNGDYFVFELFGTKILLVWNREFKYIGYLECKGRTSKNNENTISVFTEKEIIIFGRE